MDHSEIITLSIIIPTFNSSKTLTTCLESLVFQNFQNFEILIIDGLSKDDTVSIASSFSNRFKYFKVLSEKDNGTYDAMNKGINISKGKWLFFLGSDDTLWDNKVLEYIFINNKVILESNDLLYGDVFSNRLGGRYDGPFSTEKILNNNICHQAIFYKKSLFTHLGIYNLKYKISADWDFNLRCFLNPSIRKKYLDMIVSNFADGGLSTTNPHDIIHWNDRIENIVKYDKGALSKKEIAQKKGELALSQLVRKIPMAYKNLLYALIFSNMRLYFFKSALKIKFKNLPFHF